MDDSMTTREMADLYGVTVGAATRWCQQGLVKAHKVDGRWYILRGQEFRPPGKGGPRKRPGYHILSDAQVAEVRALGKTMRNGEIAEMYRISPSTVTRLLKNERRVFPRENDKREDLKP